MKKRFLIRSLSFVLAAMVFSVLSACMLQANNNTASEEQIANRDYMTQANRIMDTLMVDLTGFNKAVSDEDIVGMNDQADSANKTINELAALTPPNDLKDVHSEYVKGCEELRDALRDYRDLYTEISSATESQPFDYSTFDSRLSKIKQKYDSGISHLEKADQKARDMT